MAGEAGKRSSVEPCFSHILDFSKAYPGNPEDSFANGPDFKLFRASFSPELGHEGARSEILYLPLPIEGRELPLVGYRFQRAFCPQTGYAMSLPEDLPLLSLFLNHIFFANFGAVVERGETHTYLRHCLS